MCMEYWAVNGGQTRYHMAYDKVMNAPELEILGGNDFCFLYYFIDLGNMGKLVETTYMCKIFHW